MSIFETKAEMPPQSGSSLAVRTAQTRTDYHENLESAMNVPDKNMSVVNVQRPRRGHGY
jgi:hypothetical protein